MTFDTSVITAMAKWPNVPDVYNWLMLDARGRYRIRARDYEQSGRFDTIGNAAVVEFIGRNTTRDDAGRWYFQNGPQRVFVQLAYTPLVLHFEGEALLDHCGRPFQAEQAFLDDEGSVLMLGKPGIGLLDDRDLAAYADRAAGLPGVAPGAVPGRFGFAANPSP